MSRFTLLTLCLSLVVGAAACTKAQPPQALVDPTYFATENPKSLRDWGMVQVSGDALVLGQRVTPYDLTTPLFTDYAQKLRTIWMPPGAAADYKADQPDEALAFPVGTVITKTFFYQTGRGGRVLQQADQAVIHDGEGLNLKTVRMVETRLLIHRPEGWATLTYLWNEAQTEAVLHRVGAVIPLKLAREDGKDQAFSYIVPNVTQCSACHATNVATRLIQPIGPKARLLNREFAYADGSENQLSRLTKTGYLRGLADPKEAPADVSWTDQSASLEARARAYLDVNCGHCHNPKGPADTSGLYLNAATPVSGPSGVCKLPVAAGPGTGNLRFDIVPGDAKASILSYRMASTNPAVMMPEIGRSTAHAEGVALVGFWIDSMEGSCR
ncbi:SO2930 family diheme c-type cytochrome [Brevundimonas bullata]|uniref:SO2930 family diheme c-type cytochrome n=1 Tax=Brevundimonas bullata TaxID=13160 RepID=UPI002FD8AAB2